MGSSNSGGNLRASVCVHLLQYSLVYFTVLIFLEASTAQLSPLGTGSAEYCGTQPSYTQILYERDMLQAQVQALQYALPLLLKINFSNVSLTLY